MTSIIIWSCDLFCEVKHCHTLVVLHDWVFPFMPQRPAKLSRNWLNAVSIIFEIDLFYNFDVCAAAIPGMTVFNKGGVQIMFAFERSQAEPTQITIMLTAVNMNNDPLHEFVFQAAVPKVS